MTGDVLSSAAQRERTASARPQGSAADATSPAAADEQASVAVPGPPSGGLPSNWAYPAAAASIGLAIMAASAAMRAAEGAAETTCAIYLRYGSPPIFSCRAEDTAGCP